MSDEERDKYNEPHEGESDHEWMQRMTSPELRWLDLFERLTARVEASESRIETNEEEAKRREERIQGRIEFILQQQAQFNVDMQQLRETQARSEAKWERTAEGINALLAIAELHQQEMNEQRRARAEAQARTDAQVAEARARADAKSAETDGRLNALINTVERLISERRNGGGKREEGSG